MLLFVLATLASADKCTPDGYDRYGPGNEGKCCNEECREARPLGMSNYCAPGASGHGSSCWDDILMCRAACCSSTGLLLTSHRGKQLEDRTGAVGLHNDKGAWQEWTFSSAGNGKHFLTSHRGYQLEERNGALGLHTDKGAWQEWTVTGRANGKYLVKSHFGKYLEDRNGALGLHSGTGAWQEWTIQTRSGEWPCASTLTPVDKNCGSEAQTACQGKTPCADLREGNNHHHPMTLNKDGTATIRYTSRKDGKNLQAGRSWTATCTKDCAIGLVGTWSTPGFYGGTITITSAYADDFTSARSNDRVEFCAAAPPAPPPAPPPPLKYCGFAKHDNLPRDFKPWAGSPNCGLQSATGAGCSTGACPNLEACKEKCEACGECVGFKFNNLPNGDGQHRCWMTKSFAFDGDFYADYYGSGWQMYVNTRHSSCTPSTRPVAPPVDCAVHGWGGWGSCSRECDCGTRTRTRAVRTAAAHGGAACPSLSQTQACNSKPCPVDCAVNGWGGWGTCSATCGDGTRTRTRAVQTPAAHGGAACPSLSQTQACNSQACPVDCAVKDWGAWGTCSEKCGGGTQARTRAVQTPAAHGGAACPSTEETRACNPEKCVCDLSMLDPVPKCEPDDAGYAVVDMDYDGSAMSIEPGEKLAHQDQDRVNHGKTDGKFTYEKKNGRYLLPCKQAKAQGKTVKVTVTRPAALTALGSEWVALYPKDSWENTTHEHEPYTFNAFGSKVPLSELRPISDEFKDDAKNTDTMVVYMAMSDDGDYELRYGNPNLVIPMTSVDRWIAFEFSSSQVRVGSPWAACSDQTAVYTGVGTIIPLYLGTPALEKHESYTAVAAQLSGINVPTKVILAVYTLESQSGGCSDSGLISGQASNAEGGMGGWGCYNRNNGNPHGNCHTHSNYNGHSTTFHIHGSCHGGTQGGIRQTFSTTSGTSYKLKFQCYAGAWDGGSDTDYLEISTNGGSSWTQYGCAPGAWQDIEHQFTASGSTDFIIWADGHECIDVDDITLEACSAGPWTESGKDLTCYEEKAPKCAGGGAKGLTYKTCYPSGDACPKDHKVCKPEYCHLDRWRSVRDELKKASGQDCAGASPPVSCTVEVLGLIETKKKDPTTQEIVARTAEEIKADIKAYNDNVPMDGFYFNEAHGDKPTVDALLDISNDEIRKKEAESGKKFVAFGLGSPLFDDKALKHAGAPDTWVTLQNATDDIGAWTPFSWYPYEPQTTWAAIVSSVAETDVRPTMTTLFDRGYGYVYLNGAADYSTVSELLDRVVHEIPGSTMPEPPCLANEHVSSNQCVPCAAGTTNAAGDDASGVDTSCDAVLCAANEQVSSHQCVPCAAGTTNAAGDDASGANTQCSVYWCAEGNDWKKCYESDSADWGDANEAKTEEEAKALCMKWESRPPEHHFGVGRCADRVTFTEVSSADAFGPAIQTSAAYAFGSGSLQNYCTDINGGKSDEDPQSSATGLHCYKNVIDGVFGNSNSWIPGSPGYVGVAFASPVSVSGFALARDLDEVYADRVAGTKTLFYTTNVNPTASSSWTQLGSPFTITATGTTYQFSSPVEITGIKLETDDGNDCIDEFVLYKSVYWCAEGNDWTKCYESDSAEWGDASEAKTEEEAKKLCMGWKSRPPEHHFGVGRCADRGRRLSGSERRLQPIDDGITRTAWGCDDTLFECAPVCLQTRGVTRTKVTDSKCTEPKPDECSCRCFHDAHWACSDGAVACRATLSGQEEAAVVGDRVCTSRGTSKPEACGDRLDTARGTTPAAACLPEVQQPSEEAALFDSLDFDILSTSVPVAVAAALLALA